MKEEPIELYKPAEELELKELREDFPKSFKKISCPSCKDDVSVENINLQHKLGKCVSCNTVFSIEEDIKSIKSKQLMKQEVIRPEGIDLFYYKNDVDITVQQHVNGLDAMGMIFFPLFAIISIIVFFTNGIPFFWPIIFTLGTLYFIYRGVSYPKYKTYININDKILSIKSRPRNLKKDKTYSADEIDQLYLKEIGEGSGYYTIHMIVNGMEGQKREKILAVNSLAKAKFLEQEIEKYLGIEDRVVLGAEA